MPATPDHPDRSRLAAPASGLAPVVLEGRHIRLEPLSRGHAGRLLAAASGSRETYRSTWVPRDEAEMLRSIEPTSH